MRPRRRKLDFLLDVILVILSVGLGLKLLWADDPIWGGFTACITAILWGLGLHQVSNQAFAGPTSLLTKITQ